MVRSRGQWVVPVVASVVLCSLLLGALLVGVPGISPTDDGADRSADVSPGIVAAQDEEFQPDRTDFDVTVFRNGSATWTFRYEMTLDGDEERRDFETFAEEFNEQEMEMYESFRERAENLATSGTDATGREMAAEGFGREARVEGLDDDLGVVEMEFRWTGFAESNDRVVVGDVFQGGMYVGPEQRLVFRPGPDLVFDDVQPEDGQLSHETLAESTSVTWEGERSFTDSRPRVVFADHDQGTGGTGPGDGTRSPVFDDAGWLLPMGAFVVLLLGLGAAVAYRTGVLPPGEQTGSDATGDGTTGGSVAGASGATVGEAAPEGAAAVPEEELVSDEERVVSLLEDNGGRMKQVNIVDETGWSKSKVSMLLSDMEDEGTISKLRVGRENIVSLAGHEPDAAGSPFEDGS